MPTIGAGEDHPPREFGPSVEDDAGDPATLALIRGETDVLPEPMATDWIIVTRTDDRICHVTLWFMDAPSNHGMTRFAREVLPRVR